MRGPLIVALLSIFVLLGSQWRADTRGATLAPAIPSISVAAAQEVDDAQDNDVQDNNTQDDNDTQDNGNSVADDADATQDSADVEQAAPAAPTFPYRLGLVASDGRGTLRIDPSTTGRRLMDAAFSGKVDLAALFPRAGRQSDQDSCVAWAVAYVRTYYEVRDGRRSALDPPFSPSFVYNQCNSGADDGCTVVDALRIVQDVGLVPISDFPYDPGNFQRQPDASLLRSASALRIAGFGRLWGQGEQPSVNDLRQSLSTGDPVILGVSVYDDDAWAQGPLIDAPTPDDALVGGHAVVAVGFDDDAQLFKVANTWGDDWGDNGYGYLTYAYVDGGYAPEAWVMIPSLAAASAPQPSPVPLSAISTSESATATTDSPAAAPLAQPPSGLPPAQISAAPGAAPDQPLPPPPAPPSLDSAPIAAPAPAPFVPSSTPTLTPWPTPSPSPTQTASPTPTQGSSTAGSSPSNPTPATGAPDQEQGQGAIHRATPSPAPVKGANADPQCPSHAQCQTSGPKK